MHSRQLAQLIHQIRKRLRGRLTGIHQLQLLETRLTARAQPDRLHLESNPLNACDYVADR
jgi:hypothetical protein